MQQGFTFPFSKCVSGTLVFVLLANIVLFGVLMAPKRAEAMLPTETVIITAPTIETPAWKTAEGAIGTHEAVLELLASYKEKDIKDTSMDAKTTMQYIWEQIKSPLGILKEISKALFLVLIHQMLAKTTNDIVVWINGGGGSTKGKIRVMQDPKKFLQNSIDEAGGVLMGSILGVDSRTLCDASFLKLKLAPALLGPYSIPTFNEKVACTFSGMAEGLRKFKEDFRNGGWSAWIEYTQRQNNQIGMTLDMTDELAKEQAKSLETAKTEAGISKGFLSQKKCTITKTPLSDPGLVPGMDLDEAFADARSNSYNPSQYWEDQKNQAKKQYRDVIKSSSSQIAEAQRLGLNINYSDIIQPSEYVGNKIVEANNIDDFKIWIISNGGQVECKIVTPSEQISALATDALEAPIKTMQGILTGLMDQLPNDGGGMIRPYLNAIAGASLNLMLNKEKGLIAGAFAPPTKNRNQRPKPSDSLQDNAARASSAGQIASSANGFQAFILKSLVDFSIFVNTAAQVQDSSDELGRLPLNRVEYTKVFEDPQGGDYNKGNSKYVTEQFLYESDPKVDTVEPVGKLRGWLTNIDCPYDSDGKLITSEASSYYHCPNSIVPIYEETGLGRIWINGSGDIRITVKDSKGKDQNIAVAHYKVDKTDPNDLKFIIDSKMITTYPSGKTFFEEANWCGAYSQETPLQIQVDENPMAPYATDTDLIFWSGFRLLESYNDNGDKDGVLDRFTRSRLNHIFPETFIIPGSDINHSNALESTTTTGILLKMKPDFSDNVINSSSNTVTAHINAVAQPAAANGFMFGGYNTDGFSSAVTKISDNSSDNSSVANLPTSLAGAEAVYYPPNNRVYIFGGRNQFGLLNTVYEFDIKNQTVRNMSAHFPKGIYGMTGAYSPDTGRIYLFGGKMGDTHPTTGDPTVSVTDAAFSDQIFEFNQQADTLVAKNAKLPEPMAHSSTAPATDKEGKKIYIFGGIDQYGQASNAIIAYDPKADDDSRAVTRLAKTLKSPRGYLAAIPKDANTIRVIGGESTMGRWDVIEEYNANLNTVTAKPPLVGGALSQMGRSLENNMIVGGIKNSPANDPGAMIFPQGDIYYIPGGAEAVSRQQPILQKYYSPSYEGGSVSLLNIRENRAYKDPTLTVLNPDIMNEIHTNGDEVYLPKDSFYPELNEKIQELMEKLRIVKGYHYKTPNQKDYEAGIAQQVGSIPDDDPYDNSPHNTNYPDRPIPVSGQINCSPPDVWDAVNGQCLHKGYKGSVSDVMNKYKNIADAYQTLYSGVNDEHALEGIDQNMTVLTPTETNMKLALIGQRCPTLRPTATSTVDVTEGCPAYGAKGEYNMAKRFMFAADDTRANPSGMTTGFATNPFNNKKSSTLAGILNLDEMATQLQSLPPDKNIVKLVRLRQILEQLQICEVRDQNGKIARDKNNNPRSCVDTAFNKNLQQISPPPIRLPGKSEYINPEPLEGVELIQTSLFGFEKIQNWLNSTSTVDGLPDRNKNIQELVEAYGYTSAKEAYPEISKDLDTALQDAINQVTDKVREVFLKRTEENLEASRIEAQYRLERFIEYARDLGSTIKLGVGDTEARRLGGALVDTNADQIDNNMFVLRVEAFTSDAKNPRWVDNIIKNDAVDNNQRSGLIGSAIYKIKSLARFIGIDTGSIEFTSMITQYANSVAPSGAKEAEVTADLNKRLKGSIEDAYLLYRGVSDQTNPDLSSEEIARTKDRRCGYTDIERAYYCDLNGNGSDGKPIRIYKDASMKLKELENNFDIAIEEFNKIKDDFSQTINDAQSQKQGFEDLLTSFTGLQEEYNKANACAGMPDVKWQPSATNSIVWSTIGTTATILGAAYIGAAISASFNAAFGVILTASGGLLLPLAVIGAAIFAFTSDAARKKAHRKYDKAIRKAKDDCVAALTNYNRKLGQLADSFVCGRTNTIYQEQ